MTFSTTQPL